MTNKQLAKKIARTLFSPSHGPEARNLSGFNNCRPLGWGWAEKPMVDHLLKILDAAKPSGDTKRLDYLEGVSRGKDVIIVQHETKTIRAAIDAAMKQKGKRK